MSARTDEPPSVPAVQALHLADLVQRWGVSRAALFRGTGVDECELSDPSRRLPVDRIAELVERARALTGEPGLGMYFGLRMQAASHGYLGFAAMTASTLGEALDLATRFAPMLTNAFSLELRRAGTTATLVVQEEADLGAARDAILLALVIGIWRIGCTLSGVELPGTAELAFPEPTYFARFRPGVAHVQFGRDENRLVFDRSVLDYPLATADPAALSLAREQCERAIEALGFEGRVVARVKSLIPKAGGGFRSLEDVASRLKLPPRTLKRKLAAAGTGYLALLDEARLGRAERLLEATDKSIDEVAALLGYSDTANFTRAFRRWTRSTPAAYRRTRDGTSSEVDGAIERRALHTPKR
jgi:AraC-like DNA-binding protein